MTGSFLTDNLNSFYCIRGGRKSYLGVKIDNRMYMIGLF